MALDHNRLTKISALNPMADHATAPDPSLWYYKTADTLAALLAANYFSAESNKFEVDDRIWCEAADGHHMIKVTAMTHGLTPSVTVAAFAGNTARGQATTVTASDTIVTGLASLSGVIATLDSAPVLTCAQASASIGDQAGAPAAGSFLLQTWMPTDATHPTLIAATTFGNKVNWLAWQ